jgi:hypothetical protein
MAAISMADEEQILTEKHILLNNEDKDVTKVPFDFTQAGMDWYLENMEKEMIIFALAKHNRNISRAAEFLKIKRQTLQHKIKSTDFDGNAYPPERYMGSLQRYRRINANIWHSYRRIQRKGSRSLKQICLFYAISKKHQILYGELADELIVSTRM